MDDAAEEARIRDAMQAIRDYIVRPVRVGGRQYYVYDPGAYHDLRGKKNATD